MICRCDTCLILAGGNTRIAQYDNTGSTYKATEFLHETSWQSIRQKCFHFHQLHNADRRYVNYTRIFQPQYAWNYVLQEGISLSVISRERNMFFHAPLLKKRHGNSLICYISHRIHQCITRNYYRNCLGRKKSHSSVEENNNIPFLVTIIIYQLNNLAEFHGPLYEYHDISALRTSH